MTRGTLNMDGDKRRKSRTRANGTGTAVLRGKYWQARVIVGWKLSKDGSHKVPEWRTKDGFATKKEAINYCPTLMLAAKKEKKRPSRYTLKNLYEEWEPFYSPRVGASTMVNYLSAYKHFAPLHTKYVDLITASDLQSCMDSCQAGKRTHQNMKVVAGLLWAYAMDKNILDKDVTDHLFIGKHETVQRDPITEQELAVIINAMHQEQYASYVVCLCYLGFRPGEFLSLRKDHYKVIDGIEVLINGSKTEAGKDRIVVIPPCILDIVRSNLWLPGTDLLFPRYVYKKGKDILLGFKQMSDAYFRESVFKPMMSRLGIAEGKVPYCARHTYSDKLKNAEGSDKAKAGLMGHTTYDFTKSHYQSTDLDDLIAVAVSMR